MPFEWAKPGVKCVCVDIEMIDGLELDRVYTLAEISIRGGVFKGRHFPQLVCASLAEVANPNSSDRDGSYALQRFRPLVTQPEQNSIRKKETEYA